MSIQFQLLPLFVQVLLTFVILLTLAGQRFRAVRAGEVRGSVALRERNWPPYAQQAEFSYQNQFELPVLFYVLTILAIYTRHADLLFVLLAWVFVVLRVLQAAVHVTNNNINYRGPLFIAGAIVLMIMWAIFAIRILLGLP